MVADDSPVTGTTLPPDSPLRTAAQMAIRALADSEADLEARLIDALRDAESYRLLAVEGMHLSAAMRKERDAARAQNIALREELRALRQGRAA